MVQLHKIQLKTLHSGNRNMYVSTAEFKVKSAKYMKAEGFSLHARGQSKTLSSFFIFLAFLFSEVLSIFYFKVTLVNFG